MQQVRDDPRFPEFKSWAEGWLEKTGASLLLFPKPVIIPAMNISMPEGGKFWNVPKEELTSIEHPFFEYSGNRRLGSIKTVGYRYGEAPEGGQSFNTATNKYEEGVSLASAAGGPESKSFATMSAKSKRKKYYYEGDVIGYGGDDEPIMANIKNILASEYKYKVNSIEAKEAQLLFALDKVRGAKILKNLGYSGEESNIEKLIAKANTIYNDLIKITKARQE